MTDNSPKSSASEQIEENLRLAYESVLNEEVPERFSQLLEQLKSGKIIPRSDSADEVEGNGDE